MKLYYLLSVAVLLIGCDSEVDKCVKAQMNHWKEIKQKRKEQILNEELSKSQSLDYLSAAKEFNGTPMNENNLNLPSDVEVEAQERLRCLKVASSK